MKTLNRQYMILYRGQLAERCLTGKGAQRRAWELVKEKQWDIKDVKVEIELEKRAEEKR